MRLVGFGIALMLLSVGVEHAEAAPIDGRWKFEFPCGQATGLYAERCKAGETDFFQLSLRTSRDKVCGSYALTMQMGNHVDEGNLIDWTFTRARNAFAYKVRFHFTGVTGDAAIRVDGSKLLWQVTGKARDSESESPWLFYPPTSATLIRQSSQGEASCVQPTLMHHTLKKSK